MSKDDSSTSTVLLAFVVGALAGAAIALLYAPAPGDETRRRVAAKIREGREKLDDLMARGAEAVSEIEQEAR